MAVNYITSREVWERRRRQFRGWFAGARRQVPRALARRRDLRCADQPHHQIAKLTTLLDEAGYLNTSSTDEEKVAALAELICRAGGEAGTRSAALLVLMSTQENASHPKTLANLAKHLAFTRCGELNFNGVVEAQIAVFESELLADDTLVS